MFSRIPAGELKPKGKQLCIFLTNPGKAKAINFSIGLLSPVKSYQYLTSSEKEYLWPSSEQVSLNWPGRMVSLSDIGGNVSLHGADSVGLSGSLRRPDMVPSKVAVKSPLSDIFSRMHNPLVAGHGTWDLHLKIDD